MFAAVLSMRHDRMTRVPLGPDQSLLFSRRDQKQNRAPRPFGQRQAGEHAGDFDHATPRRSHCRARRCKSCRRSCWALRCRDDPSALRNTTYSSRSFGSRPGKYATTFGASTRFTSLFRSSEALRFSFTGRKSRDSCLLSQVVQIQTGQVASSDAPRRPSSTIELAGKESCHRRCAQYRIATIRSTCGSRSSHSRPIHLCAAGVRPQRRAALPLRICRSSVRST